MSLLNNSNIIITNNGVSLEFTPQSLKPTYESLASDDSGRTADGVMHIGSWLQRKLAKLEITLPPYKLTDSTYSTILSMVQGQEYSITYYDIINKAEESINVYTSNSSGEWYSGVVLNGIVQGVSFNAIAVGGGTITPQSSVQTSKSITYSSNGTFTLTPDSGYTSLQQGIITVNVPGGGITPTGTLTVSAPGTYNCYNYASVNVNIPTYNGGVR